MFFVAGVATLLKEKKRKYFALCIYFLVINYVLETKKM